eukprot:396259_1
MPPVILAIVTILAISYLFLQSQQNSRHSLFYLSTLILLTNVMSDTITCSTDSPCASSNIVCNQNEHCYIDCLDDHACRWANITCPLGPFDCLLRCDGGASCQFVTINATNTDGGNLIAEAVGGNNHFYKATVYCPNNGHCNVSVAITGSFNGGKHMKVYGQKSTLVYIYGGSGTAVLAGTEIHCPTTNMPRISCIISLRDSGYGQLMNNMGIYAVESFSDVKIICNAQVNSCYTDTVEPILYCTSNFGTSCRIQRLSSFSDWECIDGAETLCNDYTLDPTQSPSLPTSLPTFLPTILPSITPSVPPSVSSFSPSTAPTSAPSFYPSKAPTSAPSFYPSKAPTSAPSFYPSKVPTSAPSFYPSKVPTSAPSFYPSVIAIDIDVDSNVQMECIWLNNSECTSQAKINMIICCDEYIYGLTETDSIVLGKENIFDILTQILMISVIGFALDILWLLLSSIIYFCFYKGDWDTAEKIILPISIFSSMVDIAFTFCMFGLVLHNHLTDIISQLLENNCFSRHAIDEITNIGGLLDNVVVGNSVQGVLDFVGLCAVCYRCKSGKEGIGWEKNLHYFISVIMDLLLGGLNTFYFTYIAYNQFKDVYSNNQYLCYSD